MMKSRFEFIKVIFVALRSLVVTSVLVLRVGTHVPFHDSAATCFAGTICCLEFLLTHQQ